MKEREQIIAFEMNYCQHYAHGKGAEMICKAGMDLKTIKHVKTGERQINWVRALKVIRWPTLWSIARTGSGEPESKGRLEPIELKSQSAKWSWLRPSSRNGVRNLRSEKQRSSSVRYAAGGCIFHRRLTTDTFTGAAKPKTA